MNPRDRIPDEVWFAQYGATVGAAAASVGNPELVREFNAIVAPLETRSGKALGEPSRAKCFAAFCENPEGFRGLVDAAWARGTRNPVGPLIRMVEAGEHRLSVAATTPTLTKEPDE